MKKVELTKGQQFAARLSGKNILVSAGAGTGKTSVLVERFLNFVVSGQVPVSEILALTFTEKAANEMKSRIRLRLMELGIETAVRDLESACISTLHAFAARVLKEHPLEAGVDPDFRVIEEEEMDFLREQALDELLELHCQKGNDIFELLHRYGEWKIKEGLTKVLQTARHEGKTLSEFFETSLSLRAPKGRSNPVFSAEGGPASGEKNEIASPAFGGLAMTGNCNDITMLLSQLGEKKLAADLRRFEKNETWDWEAIRDFREWSRNFSRRGKEGEKEIWKEMAFLCNALCAQKIENLAQPWKEKFESLALGFEGAYEKKKRERGVLDFDDLEIFALRLFRKKDRISEKILQCYREKFRQIMVDEFQDTNRRQAEFIELMARGDNLFFVGDFKQSIYAFRGAEADLFLEKEKSYLAQKSGIRISLVENFRTSEALLEWINVLFQNLWEEDDFSFEPLEAHAGKAAKAGAELLIIQPKEGEGLAACRMREAAIIADKILELSEEGIAFGDMAVLFQAMTDTGIYEQALKRQGIPYDVVSGRGFYHQPEIRDMISFLSFLENPLADIPLAASLRSPLFQLKDNTLFWLSHHAKGKDERDESTPLYEGVKHFEGMEEIPEEEKAKIRFFVRVTHELFGVKDRLKLPELLDLILAKTSYELTVLSGPQGTRKYANLKKLMNLARQFEAAEPLSMADFLKTLRRLETREARESEAPIAAEESGRVVRLLSIHGAKGLEFPVVFVADLGRGKHSPESKTIIARPGMGYSLQVYNAVTLEKEEPASWNKISESIKRKEREEWKRLFYVALTRVKRRLILSGVAKEKTKRGRTPSENEKGVRSLLKEGYHEMSSWMDWLMAMPPSCLEKLIIHKDDGRLHPGRKRQPLAGKMDLHETFGGFEPRPIENAGIPVKTQPEKIEIRAQKILAQIVPPKRIPSRVIDLPVSAYVLYAKDPAAYRRIYEIGYPDRARETEDGFEWFEENDVSAADFGPRWSARTQLADRPSDDPSRFGTAVHRVLERLDFKDPRPAFGPWADRWLKAMGEEKNCEAREILKAFIQSPVFKKIHQARAIYRELPFVLNERHGLIYGVLDLLFQDAKGRWHILDYKTAAGDTEKAAGSGYDLQIRIYGLAVSRILGAVPQSGMIYFLKNGWNYSLSFNRENLAAFGDQLKRMQEEILGAYHVPQFLR